MLINMSRTLVLKSLAEFNLKSVKTFMYALFLFLSNRIALRKAKIVFRKAKIVYPIALRKAKIVYNFGLSKCNRVKGGNLKVISLMLCCRFPMFPWCSGGWSGGAMVLGKLPAPGHPTSLDRSRARAFCSCSRCGWGLFGHFYSHLSSLSSLSLSLEDDPI